MKLHTRHTRAAGRLAVVLVAMLALPAQLAAQTGVIVLKMSASSEADARKQITITLVSGQKISIPLADVDVEKTYTANGVVMRPEARPSVSELPAVSSSSSTPTNIRRHCEQEWGTDFKMRVHCQQQQVEAMNEIGRRVMTDGSRQGIRIRCEGGWPNDYRMRNHCEKQQLKALGQLER